MRGMSEIHKRGALVLKIIVMLTLLSGCGEKELEPEPNREKRELELSMWIADWQWQAGLEDVHKMSSSLSSVQLFAAYFDHMDRPFYTKEGTEAMQELFALTKESEIHTDLTIVNDRFQEDGSAVQKDSELITRLMATSESRREHIKDIIEIVTAYDFQGVEIDYEKITETDWQHVIDFYEELYKKLQSMDKTLRIVLEPRAPLEKLDLPEGPEYVMMAYNLYGTHSEPGPKADHAFIRELAERMQLLPGDHVLAFATGGFDWSETGEVTAVTEREAVALSEKSVQSPERDPASGSMNYEYIDDDNVRHIVWYADTETLSEWMNTTLRVGFHKIALWRAGGFEQGTIDWLNDM